VAKPDLDERRSKLTGRLITRLALAYDRKLKEGTTSKYNIPKSQQSFLIHLELNGSRVSALADRLGVSKQAISRMSQELEEKGLVKRVEDQTDGGATMLFFTERGRKLVQITVDRLEAIETEMALALGDEDATNLNSLLAQWADYLDPHSF